MRVFLIRTATLLSKATKKVAKKPLLKLHLLRAKLLPLERVLKAGPLEKMAKQSQFKKTCQPKRRRRRK